MGPGLQKSILAVGVCHWLVWGQQPRGSLAEELMATQEQLPRTISVQGSSCAKITSAGMEQGWFSKCCLFSLGSCLWSSHSQSQAGAARSLPSGQGRTWRQQRTVTGRTGLWRCREPAGLGLCQHRLIPQGSGAGLGALGAGWLSLPLWDPTADRDGTSWETPKGTKAPRTDETGALCGVTLQQRNPSVAW